MPSPVAPPLMVPPVVRSTRPSDLIFRPSPAPPAVMSPFSVPLTVPPVSVVTTRPLKAETILATDAESRTAPPDLPLTVTPDLRGSVAVIVPAVWFRVAAPVVALMTTPSFGPPFTVPLMLAVAALSLKIAFMPTRLLTPTWTPPVVTTPPIFAVDVDWAAVTETA